MTQKEIADYYSKLSNGEKGRFTAFLSMNLGGSPYTWQQKILGWARNIMGRPMSPVVEKELSSIVEKDKWRMMYPKIRNL